MLSLLRASVLPHYPGISASIIGNLSPTSFILSVLSAFSALSTFSSTTASIERLILPTPCAGYRGIDQIPILCQAQTGVNKMVATFNGWDDMAEFEREELERWEEEHQGQSSAWAQPTWWMAAVPTSVDLRTAST